MDSSTRLVCTGILYVFVSVCARACVHACCVIMIIVVSLCCNVLLLVVRAKVLAEVVALLVNQHLPN